MAPKTPPSRTNVAPDDTITTIPFHPRTPSQPRIPPTTPLHAFASHHTTTDNIIDINVDSPLHFSPSKARAVAAQTQQLSILTRWLASLVTASPTTSSTTTTTRTDPSSATTATAATASGVTSTTPARYHELDNDNDDTGNAKHPLISRWQAEQQRLRTTNPELAAETTRWLQATMETNRLADERRRLMFEAKRAEVERLTGSASLVGGSVSDVREGGYESEEGDLGRLMGETYQHLSPRGQEALDSLAETAVLLGCVPFVDSPTRLGRELAQAVMGYTLRTQDVHEQFESLKNLQRNLKKQLDLAESQIVLSKSERQADLGDAEQLHPQTLQWNREAKQISMKIREYQDRVAALERSRPGSGKSFMAETRMIRVEDIVETQEHVRQRREVLKGLEETVKSLHGLPPDLNASRQEVRRARSELEKLKARREELFGILAGR